MEDFYLSTEQSNNRRVLSIILTTLILVVIFLIFYFIALPIIEKKLEAINQTANGLLGNQSINLNDNINQTLNMTSENNTPNQTINDSSTNQEVNLDIVPNPSGTLKGIDIRNDGGGGYWCNGSVDAEHKVKLYTYKNFEGIRVISDTFIESKELDNVCRSYPEINNTDQILRYDIRWTWTLVEGIDGYKIYQYYLFKNTT
ncbi:hypothetical protein COX58_02100, partial [archaeon CG_4_10_14_0_2_um_filter_Archaea_38_6]